ncbi:RICIN domain-containing protein [Streptomyces californicus]|uniref:RICIN domain-containing protein n=1 Tax=Streptomyces californicus TaxID=67351 RepID=UPI003677F18F
MRQSRESGRRRRGVVAFAVAAASALTGLTVMAPSAAAAESKPVAPATAEPRLGDACTADDLGRRHPFIKSTQVIPTITHFKGWYVTDGTMGSQTVETSTQTVITVAVGGNASLQGNFQVGTLGQVGASLGLTVQTSFSQTSSESKSITWDFQMPGYYALYEGTRKVTGQYGSLNCNRVDLGNGNHATRWVEGPESGSYTTYTTLEEGAVRCEDTVPANSIMRKAQDVLGCGAAQATAERAPAADESPTPAKTVSDRKAGTAAAAGLAPGFTCDTSSYKIGTPDRSLFWTAPLQQNDTVRLRPSTIFSGNLDQWQLCRGPETKGIAEQIIVNRRTGKCLAFAEQNAAEEQAALVQADCKVDDLQRFFIYRDVPGSDKIGVQNKYTGSMIGHDRHADGQSLRQYSMGRADGNGTYILIKA